MNSIGHIEIRIDGKKGNLPITPDNYDIRELITVLQQAENLLFPNASKDRPVISYSVESGSVRHFFKTSLQAVIGFNAWLSQIETTKSIDFLESPTAKAFEIFQDKARKQNYLFEISTSIADSAKVTIDKTTSFVRAFPEVWAETELYFYGIVVDAGGKKEANLHLDTKEFGVLIIHADKRILTQLEANVLYKSCGVRARGKQNVKTGEMDKASLELLEMIDYNPVFREDYLKSLIQKAKKSWVGVTDADDWLQNQRGYHG